DETSEDPYTLSAVRVLEVGDAVSSVIADANGFQPWIVNVRSSDAFSVVLSNLQADYNIDLFDVSGALVGRSGRPGTADDVIAVSGLDPGYYALVVSAPGAASTLPYRLAVVAGALPSDTLASNPPPTS